MACRINPRLIEGAKNNIKMIVIMFGVISISSLFWIGIGTLIQLLPIEYYSFILPEKETTPITLSFFIGFSISVFSLILFIVFFIVFMVPYTSYKDSKRDYYFYDKWNKEEKELDDYSIKIYLNECINDIKNYFVVCDIVHDEPDEGINNENIKPESSELPVKD